MTEHQMIMTHSHLSYVIASDVLYAMREGSLGIEVRETPKKNAECCEHCDTSTLSALGAHTRVMSPKQDDGDATGVPETCWTSSTGITEEIRGAMSEGIGATVFLPYHQGATLDSHPDFLLGWKEEDHDRMTRQRG